MKTSLQTSARWLLSRAEAGRRLLLCRRLSPYLEATGWFRSWRERLPVDRDGNCLPWYTYPAISFLQERTKPDMRVFEYGSGNSTLWWSQRVAGVTACEHSLPWYNTLKQRIPSNVEYIHCELQPGGEYCRKILEHANRFDVVVIDGRDRANCARNCLRALKDSGVVLWDNSERAKYRDGYEYLAANGFRRLDFTGLGPIGLRAWCTSVFYRDRNCFGL